MMEVAWSCWWARALGAREEVIQVAETLGAPVVKALLGKAVIPDRHPLAIGGIGLLGTAPSQEAMEECDTLFMVGTSFPVYGISAQARQCEVRADRH